MTKLKCMGKDSFQRVRDEGELGEKIPFETGPHGRLTRLVHNSDYAPRVNRGKRRRAKPRIALLSGEGLRD